MDGILIIEKEAGMTSHDVVAKVRKIANIRKVGHTGTLDPMATGVLPLLLGKATKLSQYLTQHDKEYIATVKLGMKTDTLDLEGKVLEEKKVDLAVFTKEKIEAVLNSFLGKQKQTPPMYSAVKVNGKKLYEYARIGETVKVEPREIEIYAVSLETISKDTQEFTFRVYVSKGTYIRVLCSEMAEKLGTIGVMSKLIRTKVDRFLLEDAVKLKDLNQGNLAEHVIGINDFKKE